MKRHVKPELERFYGSITRFNQAFRHPSQLETRDQLIERLEKSAPEAIADEIMALRKERNFAVRIRLMLEELGEWCAAIGKEHDPRDRDDEFADFLFTALGAIPEFVPRMNAAMRRVAQKNGRKIQQRHRAKITSGGKVIVPK